VDYKQMENNVNYAIKRLQLSQLPSTSYC